MIARRCRLGGAQLTRARYLCRARYMWALLGCAIVGSMSAAPTVAATNVSNTPAVDYNRDVLPILADHCFACHGPDAASREAGLRLDQREGATTELDSGSSAIVPGDTDASELLLRVSADDESLRMPPAETGKQLTADEVAVLTHWIASGANYAPHWAFVPPQKPTASAGAAHPIDAFVKRQLTDRGLTITPTADRETLIRRLSFDLRGLPPTAREVDVFLADQHPQAYERLVERFLHSPSYGERMAAFWLDGARFADTNGYQNDFNRSMWPYRDWVIDAFNANKRFDELTVEQIAGDMLPEPSLSQLTATGFHRNHRTVTEAGSLEEEWLVENVIDRVETTGTVFLGLTIGCARCHDHKFDPLFPARILRLL